MRYKEKYYPGCFLSLEIEQNHYNCYVNINDSEDYANEYKRFSTANSDTARKLFEDTKMAMERFRQELLDIGWELADDSTERRDWEQ